LVEQIIVMGSCLLWLLINSSITFLFLVKAFLNMRRKELNIL
jgi:hypothetical protein